MIRNVNSKIDLENLRGGTGIVEVYKILEPEDMLGHGNVCSRVVLKPKASIGLHQHIDDMELYYIVKGEGLFLNNDGGGTPVKSGDACTIRVGEKHGIINTGNDDLEMIAIVYYARGISK